MSKRKRRSERMAFGRLPNCRKKRHYKRQLDNLFRETRKQIEEAKIQEKPNEKENAE